MAGVIDVHDLPEEEVKIIQDLVECLRAKAKAKQNEAAEEEKIDFALWPLGVKGALTREEIYDHL